MANIYPIGVNSDSEIRDIKYAFESYMKRAELIETDVSASPDNNQLTITITFRPINQVELETIDITVERVR